MHEHTPTVAAPLNSDTTKHAMVIFYLCLNTEYTVHNVAKPKNVPKEATVREAGLISAP